MFKALCYMRGQDILRSTHLDDFFVFLRSVIKAHSGVPTCNAYMCVSVCLCACLDGTIILNSLRYLFFPSLLRAIYYVLNPLTHKSKKSCWRFVKTHVLYKSCAT